MFVDGSEDKLKEFNFVVKKLNLKLSLQFIIFKSSSLKIYAYFLSGIFKNDIFRNKCFLPWRFFYSCEIIFLTFPIPFK